MVVLEVFVKSLNPLYIFAIFNLNKNNITYTLNTFKMGKTFRILSNLARHDVILLVGRFLIFVGTQ